MTIRHGSVFVQRASAFGGVSALVAGASLGASVPAAFATVNCPTGSVAVSATVCEIVFTESGSWTPPANTTAVEALLVGGGGAADASYAGGGGDVRIVELSTTGQVDVTVAAGGSFADGGDGDAGATTIEQGAVTEYANGGSAGNASAFIGGASGNGLIGPQWWGGGSGAGAASTDQNQDGGAGLIVSSLSSTLFTDDDSCFGGGGAGNAGQSSTSATCGGGYQTDIVPNTQLQSGPPWYVLNTGSSTIVAPEPNSGGGGSTYFTFDTADDVWQVYGSDGAAGRVAIRFTGDFPAAPEQPSATLATTGAQALPLGMLAVGLGLTGASVALARRARRA